MFENQQIIAVPTKKVTNK